MYKCMYMDMDMYTCDMCRREIMIEKHSMPLPIYISSAGTARSAWALALALAGSQCTPHSSVLGLWQLWSRSSVSRDAPPPPAVQLPA